jgi:hypothetical protein
MSTPILRTVQIDNLVVNLEYAVCVERKQEGSERITTLEMVNGRTVDLRGPVGDRLWELATEGASEQTKRLRT